MTQLSSFRRLALIAITAGFVFSSMGLLPPRQVTSAQAEESPTPLDPISTQESSAVPLSTTEETPTETAFETETSTRSSSEVSIAPDVSQTIPPSITPTEGGFPTPLLTEPMHASTVSVTYSPSSPPASRTITPSLKSDTTATSSPTPSEGFTAQPTHTHPVEYSPQDLIINEIAWAGTLASPNDEWIELLNLTNQSIHLEGWRLTDEDDISIHLEGTIAPRSYFLLERTDDSTIANIAADQIYTGSLKNSGETLYLLDPLGKMIDSANAGGGGWFSGESSSRASMERRGGADIPGNWGTFTGEDGDGTDAKGSPIQGTPRQLNSLLRSTPIPTVAAEQPTPPSATAFPKYSPQVILINELAWAGTLASSTDEWIELLNTSSGPIDLSGWRLSDGGDIRISLKGTIGPHSYFLLERSDDETVASQKADQIYTGGLNNAGESLFLFDPHGSLIDSADGSSGWPAGDAASRTSMERLGGVDIPGNWVTFGDVSPASIDAEGNPILGTPAGVNSPFLKPLKSPSPTLTPAGPPLEAGDVIINEVAWAGTGASASDEWIELLNLTPFLVNFADWKLTDGQDIDIHLEGFLLPHSFYLLERSDDMTVSDIQADMIYTGGLKNSGEKLSLLDPSGRIIDTANETRRSWPAGDAGSRASMERRGGLDLRGNWGTFTGYHGTGLDSAGQPIRGSPGNPNSLLFPTPVPTWIPGRVVINEVLIRPHYDWNHDGAINTNDEFIELYNRGPLPVDLEGWVVDDIQDGGSRPFRLSGIRIGSNSYVVLFHSLTRISLNDTGDTVHLLAPDEHIIDSIAYLKVRAYNLSFGRLPDGSRHLNYGLWPTPLDPNLLFTEPGSPSRPAIFKCHDDVLPVLPRLVRSPFSLSLISRTGFLRCPPRHPVLPPPPTPFMGRAAPTLTSREYQSRIEA